MSSGRMYEALAKLRELYFRLQLHNKTKSDLFRETLQKLFLNDGSCVNAKNSLQEMLIESYQQVLDTRDITNYIMRTSSVKPLMIPGQNLAEELNMGSERSFSGSNPFDSFAGRSSIISDGPKFRNSETNSR
jgi:hypothetical protein